MRSVTASVTAASAREHAAAGQRLPRTWRFVQLTRFNLIQAGRPPQSPSRALSLRSQRTACARQSQLPADSTIFWDSSNSQRARAMALDVPPPPPIPHQNVGAERILKDRCIACRLLPGSADARMHVVARCSTSSMRNVRMRTACDTARCRCDPAHAQYGDATYWDERYAREPITFDW